MKNWKTSLLTISAVLGSYFTHAQTQGTQTQGTQTQAQGAQPSNGRNFALPPVAANAEQIDRNGISLIFESNDADFDANLKARMIDTYFLIYPKLTGTYNAESIKTVRFSIDTAYKGVAAASRGRIVYSPVWFKQKPEDIDVVTHELMHIVQNYGRSVAPGWLTEGIADYVRFKFGIDNAGAKWSLPDLKADHHYSKSYRITARFLVWIEQNYQADLVKTLDKSIRDRSYTEAIWETQTGKTLDALWEAYVANPTLK
ncbi:MAG: secretory protein [Pedobacter sp.]|nr:MAG: secretory protein [Pedobacter sp.]